MKSLYEIDIELQAAMNEAELYAAENEGEISDRLAELLDQLEVDREKKIGNICRFYKSLVAEAEMVKAEQDSLALRVKSCKRKSESLKKYLVNFVPEGEKFADANCKIGWRKSEGVNILDAEKIPDNLCKIERKPNATEIKKAIKAGEVVDGAELYAKQNIQIA